MQLSPPKRNRVYLTFKDPDVPATKTFTIYGVSLNEAVEKTLGKKAAEQVGRSVGRGRPRLIKTA